MSMLSAEAAGSSANHDTLDSGGGHNGDGNGNGNGNHQKVSGRAASNGLRGNSDPSGDHKSGSDTGNEGNYARLDDIVVQQDDDPPATKPAQQQRFHGGLADMIDAAINDDLQQHHAQVNVNLLRLSPKAQSKPTSFNDFIVEPRAGANVGAVASKPPVAAVRAGGTNGVPLVPRQAPKQRVTPEMIAAANAARTRMITSFQQDPMLNSTRIAYTSLFFTRVICKGAFGEVWLAQLDNRQVAVKRILQERRHEDKEIVAFGSEIRLMATLHHPKIVTFVGVAWHNATHDFCAVTEYMARGNLHGFLKRKLGLWQWRDQKIQLAIDVVHALLYLHTLSPKVIHRDLKSNNILLDHAFAAKLSDFGISRKRSLSETMTAGVGTIFWTAPEVLLGKKYTEKADIYSFGVVLSELDMHEMPYFDVRDAQGKRPQGMKIIQMVLQQELRPTFSTMCPASIKQLAMRCLDAQADARPDATELLRLLQQDVLPCL